MIGYPYAIACTHVNAPAHPQGTAADAKLPVYVFIHGGGFIIGSGAVKWTVGDFIAPATEAIVVTLNYRLGVLGFMITDEPDSKASGTLTFPTSFVSPILLLLSSLLWSFSCLLSYFFIFLALFFWLFLIFFDPLKDTHSQLSAIVAQSVFVAL